MAVSYTLSDALITRRHSPVPVFFCSLAFHVFVFIIVPIATRMLRRPRTYERPQTFQLVTVPPTAAPTQPQTQERKTADKKAAPKKPVPHTKKDSRPAPKKEENLKELEQLLGGLPQPISSVSVTDGFKYDWYLRSIEDKVKRYWSPTINRPDMAVVLFFTIYGNGEISDIRIKESSRNSSLDNLAVRAVKLAAPFGKLPPKWGNELTVEHTLIASKE